MLVTPSPPSFSQSAADKDKTQFMQTPGFLFTVLHPLPPPSPSLPPTRMGRSQPCVTPPTRRSPAYGRRERPGPSSCRPPLTSCRWGWVKGCVRWCARKCVLRAVCSCRPPLTSCRWGWVKGCVRWCARKCVLRAVCSCRPPLTSCRWGWVKGCVRWCARKCVLRAVCSCRPPLTSCRWGWVKGCVRWCARKCVLRAVCSCRPPLTSCGWGRGWGPCANSEGCNYMKLDDRVQAKAVTGPDRPAAGRGYCR